MSGNPQYTLAELAERFGLEAHGDPATVVDGVGTLSAATSTQFTFLSNSKYTSQLADSQAGIVVLAEESLALRKGAALVAKDPYVAYAKIAALFERVAAAPRGIHASAVVSPSARVHPTASVGPCCVVDEGAVIEEGAILGPHCAIGPGCVVGANSRLVGRVTLVIRVTLGKRVLVHPGAVIGSDGFGLAFDRDHWVKLPQLGGVRIGDDCEIGANTTIDRGAMDDTVIGEGTKIDNQVQIGHNVRIGRHCAIVSQVGIAGSTVVGDGVQIGGQAGLNGHIKIGDGVQIAAKSGVIGDIPAGERYGGVPARPINDFLRETAAILARSTGSKKMGEKND